ncbi:malate dehydrogenase 1, mitochondrial-like [Triticum urartu]|uniref:malate dehydrogenase 1, mitochondrial-like n=1 Tax=Triticum urartu TaxID=4572 RepID=UPI002043DB53|nr:malate dehydrogenase 1, mitochondrial-like [Triticum urartu]
MELRRASCCVGALGTPLRAAMELRGDVIDAALKLFTLGARGEDEDVAAEICVPTPTPPPRLLLLRLARVEGGHPLFFSLSLYDIAATPGIAADVSHINTRALVLKGFVGDDQLGEALEGDNLAIIPAGVSRKPGMTRDDLFKMNTGIVKGLCTAIARHCHRTNPSPHPI